MTEFEYFSAMIAVILALGVTHILGQVGGAIQQPRTVKVYWVQSIWVVAVLLAHFSAWWNVFELKGALRFSYPMFLYMLIGPTALYLAAKLMMPRIDGSETVDMQLHYFAVRRSFFALMSIFVLWPTVFSYLLTGTFSVRGTIEHAIILVPIISCLVFAHRRLHAVVAVFIAVVFLAAVFLGSE